MILSINKLLKLLEQNHQMNPRLRHQSTGKTRVYQPNYLSLTQNNDFSHQKLWTEKVQQAKHIQEQKQIDRMLNGIVKERLFGQFLSQQTRISNEGYYNIQKISKQKYNPPKLPFHRRISPIKNLKQYNVVPKIRRKENKTIDVSDLSKYQERSKSLKISKKNSMDESLGKTRKNFIYPTKSLTTDSLPNFTEHCRALACNFSSMLPDVKITKQLLHRYNKQQKIVSQSIFQRFLYFFNFTGGMSIRQFSKWLENTANCTTREISFFVFQSLDESGNGFLTISDLFRALQSFPDNAELQKQIYQLMEMIRKVTEELIKTNIDSREIKPTIEQILVRNHELKLDLLRQLLKESSKELVPAECVKSTTYHISLLALEHDSAIRQKLSKLQKSQRANNLLRKNEEISNNSSSMKQDGIRFKDYAKSYEYKKSKLFTIIIKMLAGDDLKNWE